MQRRHRAGGIAAILACVVLGACGGSALPDARDAARAFADAVDRGEAAEVHAMLDEDTRRVVSVEAVAALLAANRADLAAWTAALRRAEPDSRVARVALGDGDEVVLVIEEEGFRIDGGAAALVTLSTPEEAVRALRSALRRGDLRAVLRVLARDTRTGVETEVARVLEETADTLDIEVAASGDEAVVRLTGGRTLHLVREDGEWHVVDLP